MKCVKCKGETFAPTTKKVVRKVGAQTFTGELQAHKCANCGAVTVGAEEVRRWDPALALAVARAGEPSAEGVTLLRTVAGFSGIELARMLGVTNVTVSRWENSPKHLIDRANWKALCSATLRILAEPAAKAELVAAEKPPRRVDVAAIPTQLLGPFPRLTLDEIPEMLVWANPGIWDEFATNANHARAAKRSAENARIRISGAQLRGMAAAVSIEDAEWLLAHGAKVAKGRHDITEAALGYAEALLASGEQRRGLVRAADKGGRGR